MFSILNVSSHRILGKSGSTSSRRADSQWRITNADHNRDRKRLNTAGRLEGENTGRNFTPKLAKTEEKPQTRKRDRSVIPAMWTKPTRQLDPNRGLRSIIQS